MFRRKFERRFERPFEREWDDERAFPFTGGPRGREGHFGGPRGREGFFGRGDLKFVLLELINERPMHGYEMIKALEERSGGRYTPSPGVIYPTLQLLEDRDWATVTEVEGKKVYQITEAGRAALTERQGRGERHGHGPGHPWEARQNLRQRGFELRALHTEASEVARLFTLSVQKVVSDPAQIERLRAVISQARTALTEILYSTPSSSSEEASSSEA